MGTPAKKGTVLIPISLMCSEQWDDLPTVTPLENVALRLQKPSSQPSQAGCLSAKGCHFSQQKPESCSKEFFCSCSTNCFNRKCCNSGLIECSANPVALRGNVRSRYRCWLLWLAINDQIYYCIPGSRSHLESLLSPVLETGLMVLKEEGPFLCNNQAVNYLHVPATSNMPTSAAVDPQSRGL